MYNFSIWTGMSIGCLVRTVSFTKTAFVFKIQNIWKYKKPVLEKKSINASDAKIQFCTYKISHFLSVS